MWQRSVLLLSLALLVTGCGEDPEKEAFRQSLIDKALNDETRKAGDAFQASYRDQPDVKELEAGILYRVLRDGSGEAPVLQDSVVVHYEGTRVDGEVFDSSYEREKPSTLPLKGVIRGWQKVLTKMPVGSQWEVVLPPEQAYGATSPNTKIPANSTLIFKIDLLDKQTPEE